MPSLEPLPHGSVQPIRDVIDVALDDQEIAWRQGDDETGGKGVEITLSIVKRKTIAIYRLGAKLSFLQVSYIQRPFVEGQMMKGGPLSRIYPYRIR